MTRIYIKKTKKVYKKNPYQTWRSELISNIFKILSVDCEIQFSLFAPEIGCKYSTKRQAIKAFNTHFYHLLNVGGFSSDRKYSIYQTNKDKNNFLITVKRIK